MFDIEPDIALRKYVSGIHNRFRQLSLSLYCGKDSSEDNLIRWAIASAFVGFCKRLSVQKLW